MNTNKTVDQIFGHLVDAAGLIEETYDYEGPEISVVLTEICTKWTAALVDLGITQDQAEEVTGRAYAMWDEFAE